MTLQATVDRAIQKGWIPQTDRETVIQKINRLSAKYGFSADDFATLTHIESYGMNPQALNFASCAGIIQFCPDVNGGAIKTIGGKQYNTVSIAKQMSISQQLDLVDDYFEGLITPSRRGNIGLDQLYFWVLYPGIAANYDNYGPDEDFRSRTGVQSEALYVNESRDNPLTKNSVRSGLLRVAGRNLGQTVTASDGNSVTNTGSGFNSAAGGVASSAFGNFGFLAGLINGYCDTQFPKEFTVAEAIRYTGCHSKIVTNSGGIPGINYPPQGMQVNGASAFSMADFNPNVPICQGCLAWPFRRDIRITSPFCQRRTSRRTGRVYYHSGTDYGAPQGEDVLAVADGIVVAPQLTGYPSGYDPGFVDIIHENLGNLLSRYGHINPSVQPGQRVRQGDLIGKIGPYPAGGPHLHLELRKDKGAGASAFSVDECKTKFLDPALFIRRR